MSERIVSVFVLLVAVYSTVYYLTEKDYGMALLLGILSLIGFYVVHVTWTAPVFAEDMPAADPWIEFDKTFGGK